jgi:hypothetical protein
MLSIDITVTFDDGEKAPVTCKTPDFLAFESKFDKPFSVLSEQPRLTYLLFLAWSAATRAKLTDKPFEEWSEGVANVETDSPKA